MSIEIKGLSTALNQVRGALGQRNEPAQASTKSAASSNELVSLSAGGQVKGLEKAIRAAPVVDAARVSQIRSQIADGTFQVDDNRVANKLQALESQLHRA